MKFSRKWNMPNKNTFQIPAIKSFIDSYISKRDQIIIDPFARNSTITVLSNDLNPETSATYHLEARDFLRKMKSENIVADIVLFDPPYSPRQISECYNTAGIRVNMVDTQNGKTMRECRELINAVTKNGSICLTFGWNSASMGHDWSIIEIMLVAHGGAHNDTICCAQLKTCLL